MLVSVDSRVMSFTDQGQLMNQLRSPLPVQTLTAMVSPDDDPPQGFPVVLGMGHHAEVMYMLSLIHIYPTRL